MDSPLKVLLILVIIWWSDVFTDFCTPLLVFSKNIHKANRSQCWPYYFVWVQDVDQDYGHSSSLWFCNWNAYKVEMTIQIEHKTESLITIQLSKSIIMLPKPTVLLNKSIILLPKSIMLLWVMYFHRNRLRVYSTEMFLYSY